MPKRQDSDSRPVGLTASSGWELGLRRTLPVSPDRAWTVLTSPVGTELILGKGVDLDPDRPGRANEEGPIAWELTTFHPCSHLRMKWRKAGWAKASTLQIRVISAATGTTIAIHQEDLADKAAREELLAHWAKVLDRISMVLEGKGSLTGEEPGFSSRK